MLDAAVGAAVVGAIAAVVGYIVNQQNARRERKAQFFAEALQAIKEFEELPYRIAKRSDSSPETRERLGFLINDAYVKVAYYQSWLRIDAPSVGLAYDVLARRAYSIGEPQQAHAWSISPRDSDEEMNLGHPYYYGTSLELHLCERVMRRELSYFSLITHPLTKKAVAHHIQWRNDRGERVPEIYMDHDSSTPIRWEYLAKDSSLPDNVPDVTPTPD